VPIIHYSVEWWTTLHQPASVTRFAKPTIALSMLIPLFIMLAGFLCLIAALILTRVRLERMRHRAAELLLKRGRRG